MKYSSRYPGVKPFETEEQHIFFGRSADIQSLYELVGVEKTVLFYSKSGLGKTSLINAGLIPKLKKDKHITYNPVTIRLGVYSKVNSISPKAKIIDLLQKDVTSGSLKDFPELYENTISFWLKSIQFSNPEQTHILIFDQFEELFTFPDEHIEELKKDLNELLYLKTSTCFRENLLLLSEAKPDVLTEEQLNTLTSAVNIRMLFTIRSDKLSLLNRLTDYLPNLQRAFLELKSLTPEEACNAIIKPAGIDGDFPCPKFEFTTEAVRKIINALTDEGKQPIETFQLQIVCQYAESLILKDKTKTSISPGDLGDIKDIHQSFYDNLLAELVTESEEERLRLRNLLEEQFIYEPEKRRLQVLQGIILKKVSAATLSALERTHLIRSEPYQDSFTYELSHDTLVEPILKSYHKRREEEERKSEEVKKEAELQAYRSKARRQRNIIIIVSIAALLSICSATFGFFMWHKAGKERTRAENERTSAETQRMKADSALKAFITADSLRKETEINSLLNDSRSFAMYGKRQDAILSVEKALKIDSANIEAIELLRKYRNP
jgi:hypothetical protein